MNEDFSDSDDDCVWQTLKTITAKCEAEQNAIKVEEVIQPMDQQYRSIMNELNKRSIEAKNMIEKRIEIVRVRLTRFTGKHFGWNSG